MDNMVKSVADLATSNSPIALDNCSTMFITDNSEAIPYALPKILIPYAVVLVRVYMS